MAGSCVTSMEDAGHAGLVGLVMVVGRKVSGRRVGHPPAGEHTLRESVRSYECEGVPYGRRPWTGVCRGLPEARWAAGENLRAQGLATAANGSAAVYRARTSPPHYGGSTEHAQ